MIKSGQKWATAIHSYKEARTVIKKKLCGIKVRISEIEVRIPSRQNTKWESIE